eukprot:11380634-Heterocapsa_arctica.AAC.1
MFLGGRQDRVDAPRIAEVDAGQSQADGVMAMAHEPLGQTRSRITRPLDEAILVLLHGVELVHDVRRQDLGVE